MTKTEWVRRWRAKYPEQAKERSRIDHQRRQQRLHQERLELEQLRQRVQELERTLTQLNRGVIGTIGPMRASR